MRDNSDQIQVDRVDRTDWRDPEGPKLNLNLDWPHKDKMRGLVFEGGTLWLRIESVSAWEPGADEFANVWVARRNSHGGKWTARFVSVLRRDGAVRDGTDPSGKAIFRHAIPLSVPTLPDPGEDAAWFIAGIKDTDRLGANRLYPMPAGEAPESLLPDVRRERLKFPTPIPNDDLGTLLNSVVWPHRSLGWGLAAKSTGAQTVQPFTGTPVSRDILVHPPSGLMYDVLQDVAGQAIPVWNKMTADMPWVAPVDPEGEIPPPPQSLGASTINVMAPSLERGEAALRDWTSKYWDHFMSECGFEGVHLPCQRLLPTEAMRELHARCIAEGKWLVPWLFGDTGRCH